MKRVLLPVFFCILITGQIASGQDKTSVPETKSAKAAPVKLSADDYPSLISRAKDLNAAMISGDYEKVADYTYPKILAMAGGREPLVAFMKKQLGQMQSEGFGLISNDITGVDQIEKVGTEIFAVLRTKMIMKVPQSKAFNHTSLIGISGDQGKTWTFISAIDQARFSSIFPEAAAKINILAQEAPTLIEN